ncbi:hypothetical protein CHCC20375_3472 [Bacillus licheniformis]|nr:hypothetical protein CHCC20375_3472 [Bacillus licheniformis]
MGALRNPAPFLLYFRNMDIPHQRLVNTGLPDVLIVLAASQVYADRSRVLKIR